MKTRLHKFIWDNKEVKGNYTRSDVQKNIGEFGVWIDDLLTYNRLEWVVPSQQIVLNNWPQRELGDISQIKVLVEDPHYLLLFKPFGLPVQSGAGHLEDNLVSWLVNNYPEQKRMMDSAQENENTKYSAGLVHRLDKDTQGLLLVARSMLWHKALQNEFRSRRVVKKYLAIVDGLVEDKIQVIGWQFRDKRNPRLQKLFVNVVEAKNYDINSRNVETYFTPIFYCSETKQTLVQVEIKTGRMHQIRVAAKFIGHPLSKDPIYNRSNQNNLGRVCGTSGITNISVPQLKQIKKEVFASRDFCLLSNYLKIKLPNGQVLERELFDSNQLI